MTKDTGHKVTSPSTIKKGDKGRVASNEHTTPSTYERQMRSARIIMDKYDGALRKLAKL